MVKEKIVYEVNGKVFDNKEEALKEERGESKEIEIVAEKISDILYTINTLANYIDTSSYFNLVIEVSDKEISPEWWVDKPYHSAFTILLKELGVTYSASDGDERRSGYFNIFPSKIEEVYGKYDVIRWLNETLPRLKAESEQRVQDIINGKNK